MWPIEQSAGSFPFVVINYDDIDFSSIEKDFQQDRERSQVVSGNYVSDSSLSSMRGYEGPRQISPSGHQNIPYQNASYRAPARAFEPLPLVEFSKAIQQIISDDEDDQPVEAFPDDGDQHQKPQHSQRRQTATRLATDPFLPSISAEVVSSSSNGIFVDTKTSGDDASNVSAKEIEDVLSDTSFLMNFDFEQKPKRFRDYQTDQWDKRYKELRQIYSETGRSAVHHADSSKKGLARWIKRQRAQYKLRQEDKPSSMTDDRIQKLNFINFVWDSHSTVWEDRLLELELFQAKHKHCNVTSSNYPTGGTLVSWVKSQRRQYRLLQEGRKSNLTPRRIQQLECLGFQF